MTFVPTTETAMLSPLTAGRTRRHAAAAVLICSLAVTTGSGIIAATLWQLSPLPFMLTFVYLRWAVVFALLITPLAHQALKRRGTTFQLPYVMQTPLTALLLTFESIIVDIIGAHFK
ncbi:MAG: hypothetical protein H7123_02060 [Thermoleophilia bacterium]|nr:hypothetical protein [Thermoleophilia bacterium]